MAVSMIVSDQLYQWSDSDEKQACIRPTKKTHPLGKEALRPGATNPSRLSARALQAVCQTGLQVRRRPRSWSQVLSVDHLPGAPARARLSPAGLSRAGQSVSAEPAGCAGVSRRDLFDKPRTAQASREAVGRASHGYRSRRRYGISRADRGQHVARSCPCRPAGGLFGGQR